jgi:PTH1 family peptidyl-tRNA hydrolase
MDGRLVWLVAGLGNPGAKYSRTRHNIGFLVIEEIAGRYKIALAEKKQGYRIGKGSIAGQQVLLVEPLLFMNLSGPPLRGILKRFNAAPENLIVIHDDLDMETGKLRIRKTGSAGGHKGVESVIDNIGSRDFVRVKIGIGRETGIPADVYVLGKFKRHEIGTIKDVVQSAADAVHVILSEGVDAAMNRFN